MKTRTALGLLGALATVAVVTYATWIRSLPKAPTAEQIAAENRAYDSTLLVLHQKAGSHLETLAIGEGLKVKLATEGKPVTYDLKFLGNDSVGNEQVSYELKDSKGRSFSSETTDLEKITVCWDDTAFSDTNFVYANQFSVLRNPGSEYTLGVHAFRNQGSENGKLKIALNNVAPVGINFDGKSEIDSERYRLGHSTVPPARIPLSDRTNLHIYKVSTNGTEPVSLNSQNSQVNETGGKTK